MDVSLRGHDILLADLHGTKNTWHQIIRKKVALYCTSSLLSCYKYETGERFQLIPVAFTTDSGIVVRK